VNATERSETASAMHDAWLLGEIGQWEYQSWVRTHLMGDHADDHADALIANRAITHSRLTMRSGAAIR